MSDAERVLYLEAISRMADCIKRLHLRCCAMVTRPKS